MGVVEAVAYLDLAGLDGAETAVRVATAVRLLDLLDGHLVDFSRNYLELALQLVNDFHEFVLPHSHLS